MGRGAYALARVAVIVRAPARWLWWLGLLSAGIGVLMPGLTGRRIGVSAGAALFIVGGALAFRVHQRRYAELARGASRAGRAVFLQDRAVTLRSWRRGRRWWLLAAFPVALASSLLVPAAAGLALAGLGAGLWAKALWLGGLERREGALLWVRPEWVKGSPAGPSVRGYLTTGLAAGDALPGGARRRGGAAKAGGTAVSGAR
ncbi:hypothetical protein BLA24_16120 [Streptomyces cinnamoneus]|uniref:Integral membrane protein n=1 Tax=Streptomyces cinnamoneus TaxID=53446 RepID=A0A2G1XJB4_STRCJ|nr:hypothetical protein [Streptomyces cinnamoneus]PHQ51271.1 hypothetical protein BLA24_16120 [Streptomyces cinnamoneus]PPT13503.1 hypothetical protein CYQ11_11955 [Streptomyces cinnamoneus]